MLSPFADDDAPMIGGKSSVVNQTLAGMDSPFLVWEGRSQYTRRGFDVAFADYDANLDRNRND
jgi:hypothetical protein